MSISVHVIDNFHGRPAEGVSVELIASTAAGLSAAGLTGPDGRLVLGGAEPLPPGTYELAFGTGAYFEQRGQHAFHPRIRVEFTVGDTDSRLHIPLLVTPFAFTTYRGD